ncbi:THAP domain-containing protein 1-like [Trichoplusia ni]|uniref:THAP domain-containing protein 1-like n=1 Tax=Trichoplusia ni TaxID=7111 RepID=A0A7E5WEH3_TRINI|nr:THAP domain-containing protein 1-like [Trichoplusia ni]
MPSCSVMTCKNDSRKKNIPCGGISYHRFPKDPIIKEKWIEATGRQNWRPSKLSTICTEHFENDSVLISKKGYRYLDENAIPTQNILVFKGQNISEKTETDPSRIDLQETPTLASCNKEAHTQNKQTKKACQAEDSELTNRPTDSNKGLKVTKQLKWYLCKVNKQNLKIKRLQCENLRLKKRIKSMETLLKILQDKIATKSEDE